MVKTFPITMDDNFHGRLKKAAEIQEKPIKTFVLDAIEKQIREVEEGE